MSEITTYLPIPFKCRKNAEALKEFAAKMLEKWRKRYSQYTTADWTDDEMRHKCLSSALRRIEMWRDVHGNPQAALNELHELDF